MKMMTLKIGFINVLPFSWLELDPNTSQYTVAGGFESRMWQLASEYFNFTIEWKRRVDRQFGAQLENGSWSGMIAEIIDNQIDLAVGGLMTTSKRLDVVDFLYPHGRDKFTFVYPPISHSGSPINLLIRPFHHNVYIAILLCVILFWLFSLIEKNWLRSSRQQQNVKHNLLWINLHLLVRQPYQRMSSTSTSIRIACIFWTFSSLVLANFYLGTLCSILTLPEIDEVDTIDEFVDACISGRLIPMAIDNTSIVEFFRNSQDSKLLTIWSFIVLVSNSSVPLNLIVSAHRPYSSLIAPREAMLFQQKIKGEDKIFVPPDEQSTLFPSFVATPIRKGFQNKKLFENFISRLITTGLILRWQMLDSIKYKFKIDVNAKVSPETIDEYESEVINFIDFTLENLKSIFYLYLIMILISLFTFIIEIFKHFVIFKNSFSILFFNHPMRISHSSKK
ncbi:glutamate receptor ionotropic, kainate 1-like isoform X1 [Dermatophagoides pteronyssinus]|uniref:glutamate receptor ionotropic, kainate 1-like isoform X1 n=1 Tax=Dermatophagoides pteronyssinus TaxID=6956 RepID=UPI003F662178